MENLRKPTHFLFPALARLTSLSSPYSLVIRDLWSSHGDGPNGGRIVSMMKDGEGSG